MKFRSKHSMNTNGWFTIHKLSLNIPNGHNGSQGHLPLDAESEIALKCTLMYSVHSKMITR